MMLWQEFDAWIVAAARALGCRPSIADYFSAAYLRGGPDAVLYGFTRNRGWFHANGDAARALRLFARAMAGIGSVRGRNSLTP